MLLPRPEIRTTIGSRSASGPHRSITTPRSPLRTSPTIAGLFAAVAQDGQRPVRSGRRDAQRHADAAIERAVHLVALDVAGALQPVEHRGAVHAAASITASRPSGSTRGMLPVRPPPVMCAKPCTGTSGEQRQHRLHVDAGRREQPVEERRGRPASGRVGVAPPSRAAGGPASSRWSAAPEEARPMITSPGGVWRAVDDAVLLDEPDAEAREVVVVALRTCRASRPSRRRPARSPPAGSPRRCP